MKKAPYTLIIDACDGTHTKPAKTLEAFREIVQQYAKGCYWRGRNEFTVDGISYETRGATLKECGVTNDDGFCRVGDPPAATPVDDDTCPDGPDAPTSPVDHGFFHVGDTDYSPGFWDN